MSTNVETQKVHNVYDIISKHFSTTRKVILILKFKILLILLNLTHIY